MFVYCEKMSRNKVVFDFRSMDDGAMSEVREVDIHRFLKQLNLNRGNVRAKDSDDFKRFGQVRVTMNPAVLADDLVAHCKTQEPKMGFRNRFYPVYVERIGRRPIVM